jgi:trehalose 6-phosphate phosphatase
VEISAEEKRAEKSAKRSTAAMKPPPGRGNREVRYLFDAWPETIERVREAQFRLVVLDFDGTLARLRRRPEHVRFSERGKKTLRKLAGLEKVLVAVVSGRSLKVIEGAIGVEGIRYIGLHGAARNGQSIAPGLESLRAIVGAREDAQSEVASHPGIWIEDKGLMFAVHYRGARRASVRAADRALRGIAEPLRDNLRILNGDKVWEVMPRETPGKGAAVLALLAELPQATAVMCFGDDATDEEAFAVLPTEITVKVGRRRETRARFYLRNPGEVLRCLARLEKELR